MSDLEKQNKEAENIDQSLEERIEELERVDAEKAAQLRSMKEHIADEVLEGGEAEDGALDEHDVARIFDRLYANNAELMDAMGMSTVEEFQNYLGLDSMLPALIFDKEYSRNYESGAVKVKRSKRKIEHFSEEGEVEFEIRTTKKGVARGMTFHENGASFSTYDEAEKEGVTKDEYLDLLAKHLDTPKKLAAYMALYMRYRYDDPLMKKKAAGEKNIGENKDYWQTAHETLGRIENGKMHGDCDDYAFFAREILRRQGIAANVVSIPKHAICLWFEERPDGRWNAFTLGTFGLDKNGRGKNSERGFDTLQDAVNAVLKKYDKGGLGLAMGAQKYRVKNGEVELLNVPEEGERATLDGVPLELLTDMDAIRWMERTSLAEDGEYWAGLEEFLEVGEGSELLHVQIASSMKGRIEESDLLKILQKFTEKFPTRPEYHEVWAEIYRGQPEKRFEHAQKAVELGSKQIDMYEVCILSYSKNGKHEKSAEVYYKCKQQGLQLITAYMEALDALILTGDREEARQLSKGVLDREPDNSLYGSYYVYLLWKDGKSFEDIFSELDLSDPKDKHRLYLWASSREFRYEDYPEDQNKLEWIAGDEKLSELHSAKLDLLKEMYAENPNGVLFINLSSAYLENGDPQSAASLIEQEASKYPEDKNVQRHARSLPVIIALLDGDVDAALVGLEAFENHDEYFAHHLEGKWGIPMELQIQFFEAAIEKGVKTQHLYLSVFILLNRISKPYEADKYRIEALKIWPDMDGLFRRAE